MIKSLDRCATLQMERILSAQEFRDEQVLYRGLPPSDPLAVDLKFEYRLSKLWCMECEWAAGRAVAGVALSGDNPDLVAVGYGKYLQQDQATGLVCLWSAKVGVAVADLGPWCHTTTTERLTLRRPASPCTLRTPSCLSGCTASRRP